MYLKSLEIQGFKSFPDKTVLTFGQDITAIVGPNGSGKSNISDAIRWVMGEQSTKSLRGGKMEDVIFGGTQHRKQTGYAEVSLVLDNSLGTFPVEQSEVMVTRRYYRSGESEYYINRRSCRLRDVNELFMDTGLGREGYSIIGQGRIDEILSVKSQDRRQIFEEAAGISRFRHRKEESERHLARTEENLLRINDKIAELELQVEPLRAQAETAQKYLTLRDELRGLEVSLWMEQLDRLRTGTMKLQADYARAVAQRDEAAAAQENFYARTEELQERLQEQERSTEAVRQTQSRQALGQAETEGQIAMLHQQLQTNTETIQRLELELGDQQGRQTAIAQQIDQRQTRLAQIAAEQAELQTQQGACNREMAELSAQAEKILQLAMTLQQQETRGAEAVSRAKELLSALAAASQELLDRDASLHASLQQTAEQLEQGQNNCKALQSQVEQQEEVRQEAQNRIAAWQLKTQNRKTRVQQLQERINRLRVDGNTLQSRIRMLADMERMYEGYSKSVKQIMGEAARGGLPHIRGPVAGLIHVPEAYTVALEIALGGAMQHIVVENEAAGKTAIQWLKRRDAGRATFLPLSVLRPNTLQEQGLAEEFGFVGIASELVQCDPEYRNLVRNLLGRVVIAEDMDAAITIANRYRHRFRIVTLDGQVLNPGGSMTGGSVSKSAGILSRANELKNLRTQEQQLRADLKNLEAQYQQENRQLEQLNYQLEAARGELRTAEDRLLQLKTQVEAEQRQLQALQQQEALLREELGRLDSRSGQNEEQIDQIRTQLHTLEDEVEALRARGAEQTQRHTALLEQVNTLQQQLAGLRLQEATLGAEAQTSHEALLQLQTLQQELSGDRESRVLRRDSLVAQNAALEEELQARQEALHLLLEEKSATEQQLAALNEEKLRLEAERTRVEREGREKGNELLLMEREVAALEQKKTAADAEEKLLLDKLWDNYQLSHSAAQKVHFPLESVAKSNRRVTELKRSIHALGPVHVGAIEEFDRVNGRYTYLTGQRDDVLRSKEELLGILRDLTRQMEQIFRTAFVRIQEAFSATFLELFGGGRASLELEDPQDILNCGIEIRVQPPGKALKVITLLSGGEKAFVAIALYFAILKVRPTPFVVMDEIEAALDDSNVVRFARYMRTISDHTQFIVITHRRGTMEEADTLYGVTMQEQGISRMLTLDMNEMERELGVQ